MMSTRMATVLMKAGDGFEAGNGAARDALGRMEGFRVDLCVVFASLAYDLKEVVRGIRSVVGNDVQTTGCSSAGEFTESRVDKESVALALIHSDEYSFKVAAEGGLRDFTYDTFNRLYDDVSDAIRDKGPTSIMIFIDGIAGRGEESVLSAYTTFDIDTKIVGGSAGPNSEYTKTAVIANNKVISDGVSVCVVKGGDPFVAGVRHGHTPISPPLMVTHSRENIVLTINNRPAWDAWKEATREKAREIGIDVDTISGTADISKLLIRFEMGILTEEGYKIRVPLSLNPDKSINFGCSIPEGMVFRVMGGSREDQILSAGEAARLAMDALGGRRAVGAFVFDCVCRAIILEDEFTKAVDAIKREIGNIPILGFETLGEICMNSSQLSGFHNTTSVVVLLVE